MSSIKYKTVYSHNFKTKIDNNDDLATYKTNSMSNIIVLFRHAFNKNQNHSYYHVYLEKGINKMVYYSRIDISDSIDVNKNKASKEYMVCDYWYIVDKGFRFQ